jgi:hypothetical protein
MSSIKERRIVQPWHPGSFTKNFSWGKDRPGLSYLKDAIAVGFNNRIEPVLREEFIDRLAAAGFNYYIPANFFCYNAISAGQSYILPDELVFHAVEREYNEEFDSLALATFLISIVGEWRGSRNYQRWPALWAQRFVIESVYTGKSGISADEIEQYLSNAPLYRAKTTRKVSTNLSFMLRKGQIARFQNPKIGRWWVDAIFLALDRIKYEKLARRQQFSISEGASQLFEYGVLDTLGPSSLERELALKHILRLYDACGGTDRFDQEAVKTLTEVTIQDIQWIYQNDFRPVGALHQSNPRLVKAIPPSCAQLARYAGFDILDADDLASLDTAELVRTRTRKVFDELFDRNVLPTMTMEEVVRLTRSNDDND